MSRPSLPSAQISVCFTVQRVGLTIGTSKADRRIVVSKATYAAAKNKIRPGDVIVGINNEPLPRGMSQAVFTRMIADADRPIVINFWRTELASDERVPPTFNPPFPSFPLSPSRQ